QQLPGFGAQQARHDLAIGVRGVVVGNFTQTRRRMLGSLRGEHLAGKGGVHDWANNPEWVQCKVNLGSLIEWCVGLRFCRGKTTAAPRSLWRIAGTCRSPYR